MQYLSFERKYEAAAVTVDISRLPSRSCLVTQAQMIGARLFCKEEESISNSSHSEESMEILKEKREMKMERESKNSDIISVPIAMLDLVSLSNCVFIYAHTRKIFSSLKKRDEPETFLSLESCWYVRRGQTQAKVAQAIGVSQNVISRTWNRFLETGNAGRRSGQGRRRATTPNEDRYLVLTARRHRNMNATHLQQHLRSATGTTVSTQTVRNRLHGVGLYAHRPMVCVRLTSRHRRDRREWTTEHVNWRRNEWSNVLFSDEFRFSVHPDNRRIFIWRDRGSRNNPAFVHKSVRFGGGGVFVWWHLH
ncbi:transposable element Tcb2 transposase [Trichonephila clavipes]|nr:transposable element Tcb2 transposase [Trichonephila clavipes]